MDSRRNNWISQKLNNGNGCDCFFFLRIVFLCIFFCIFALYCYRTVWWQEAKCEREGGWDRERSVGWDSNSGCPQRNGAALYVYGANKTRYLLEQPLCYATSVCRSLDFGTEPLYTFCNCFCVLVLVFFFFSLLLTTRSIKVLKRIISSTTEWDSFIPAYLVERSWICFTVCVLSRCLAVGPMRNPIFLSPLNESTEKGSTGGFQAANQSLCREIAVRHSTSLYTPRSVQCVLTSVPVLQHNSTHHSHWPVTAIILLF